MRVRYMVAFGCCLVAAACSDRQGTPTDPAAQFGQRRGSPSASSCLTEDGAERLIEALLRGGERNAAMSRFTQMSRLAGQQGPTAQPVRAQAFALIQYLLDKYQAGRMIGGQSIATQDKLQQLLNGILCVTGLPPAFGNGSLGPDGAMAFIYPTTPDTTVVTQTGWAGVKVPLASVTQPTIVTIQRLPDTPGPLLTIFDQYPIYYEFHSAPALPFSQDLVVGVCIASNATPPDPTRLRLAHNVAPFTANTAVILPLAPAPFIDCTNAPIASASNRGGFDLARVGRTVTRGFASLLLPQPLLAMPFYAAGGVGGTVRNFSPFGAVDTLGVMNRVSPLEFHGPLGSAAPSDSLPSVTLRTPTGVPMPGVAVNFAITSGGGVLGGASTVSDVNGAVKLGSWTLGATRGCSILTATATMPALSGLTGNPMTFYFCSR